MRGFEVNDLQKQVRLARRRMTIQYFLATLPWTLTATLVLATVAVVAPKLWPLSTDPQLWSLSWIGGAVALGVVLSIVITALRRADEMDAAIAIDRRYGLKERVSSSLSLNDEERDSITGSALINDAARRVSKVDVRDKFEVRANRWALLPLLIGGAAFGLTFLTDAQLDVDSSSANASTIAPKKRVQNSTQRLIKNSERLKKEAAERGLADATDLFKKLEEGVSDMRSKNDVDQRKALVKLNDIARDLQNRQRELLKKDHFQKQMEGLRDIKQGPADKLAKSLKNGDFKAAMDSLKQLQDAMKSGDMTEEQKAQLKEQLSEMKNKIQDMAAAHERMKRDLQEQIRQKVAQGDRDAANKLQNKLDQMMQQDKQMAQMQQMGEKMAQAAQAMQQGDMDAAQAQLSELAEGLEAMQAEMEEMEMLEEALDQIASAKDSMNCQSCGGMGCADCMGGDMGMDGMFGMGDGEGEGEGDGQGMGEGQGRGDRPEEETNTGFYDSQVRAKPQRGKSIVTGTAAGPNRAGQAIEDIKAEIEAAERSEDDPLTNQRLSRPLRDLTREYFEALSQ